MSHIGYKSCDEYIVTLAILGDTNERRPDVINKNHAKFRTSRCKVISIKHKQNGEMLSYIINTEYAETKLVYNVDEIISIKNYNNNITATCTTGVHYFLSYESAYYCDNIISNGVDKKWYDNGQLRCLYNYLDGNLHGIQKGWHNNGKLEYEYNYAGGSFHGTQKRWNYNGDPGQECNYVCGKKQGLQKQWYNNGDLKCEENYVNG